MHYIHYIPRIIYDISSTLCDVTFTMCVTSHNDSVCDIKHSMFMTYSFIWHHAQCYDYSTIVCLHSHYAWHYIQCILDITQNVPILWKEVNVCHHNLYLYDTICTTYDIISTLYEITPLYLWRQVHYIWHHIQSIWSPVHCICVITPTLTMISQPPYVSHKQYTCDILWTIFMISYPLCMTTQHCVCLIPHSAYVWHHLHYRCYHIHSITLNHSIYDVTSTSGMTSHPLYQTLHPLYLCHHNLSTDIIPTFVWHHTHYMDDIICTLHNIISTPYVFPLLYLCHQSLYIWNHIQYVGPHIHYTCDITDSNLCHHSHSIENITHSLYDIRLG